MTSATVTWVVMGRRESARRISIDWREGRRFSDAHSPSSVCTPTRYALLTGHYAWRHRPAAGILSGVAPLCMRTDQVTLPRVFQTAGYATAAVGKWHLGLGGEPPDAAQDPRGETNYNGRIKPGPLEIGFDYFFGVPATGDRTPCVYVENHRVVGYDARDPIRVSYGQPVGDEPTGKDHPELLKIKPSHGHDNTIVNGISRIGYMSGGRAARWTDEEMADVLTGKAVEFIESQSPAAVLSVLLHARHPRATRAAFALCRPQPTWHAR